MVFKKNLMLKVFFFINFFILLLNGCSYQYNNLEADSANVAKVNLNVNSFEIKKNKLNDLHNKNELITTINKKVLKNFEDWILIKFAISGDQNSSYLNILKIDTSWTQKNLENKSILSVIKEKKNTYTTTLNFDLTFTNNEGSTKILKVSSNIDIMLSNNFSINKRNKVVNNRVNKLIELIVILYFIFPEVNSHPTL